MWLKKLTTATNTATRSTIWSTKPAIWNGSDGINGSRELSKARIQDSTISIRLLYMCWIRGGSTIESNMFLSPCRAGISHITFLLPSYLDVLWLCSGISTKSSVKPGQKIHLFVIGSFYLFLEIYSHNSIEHDILKDKSVGLTIAFPPIQNISKGRGHG